MKIKAAIIILLLAVYMALPVRAADSLSADVYDETEFLEVKAQAEAFSKQPEVESFPEGTIALGYKLYSLDPGVFSNLITSGFPFMQLTMDHWEGCDRPYAWILPEINYCTMYHIDQKWTVASYTLSTYEEIMAGLPDGCEWAVGLVDFGIVEEKMQEAEVRGEKLTGEQLIFTFGMTNTYFFAFRTDRETYLVTFPWRPDLTGLRSGGCYTAAEVKEILDRTCPVIYAGETVEAGLAGGGAAFSDYERSTFENVTEWPPKDEKKPVWLYLAGAGILILLYAAGVYYVRKRQQRNSKRTAKEQA